jgi:RHS repeat-associated protein
VRQDDGVVELETLYDGLNRVLEEDGGTVEADYTTTPEPYGNALSQHRSGDSSFYLWDGIRNVRQLTDGAEVVTDSYGFDGWGRSTGSSGSTANTQQWQGQSIAYRKDADAGPESQYAMHHRNYNPRSGVFTAADPAKDDLNLYRYVHNNPVNRQDPSGLEDIQEIYGKVDKYVEEIRYAIPYLDAQYAAYAETITRPFTNGSFSEDWQAIDKVIGFYEGHRERIQNAVRVRDARIASEKAQFAKAEQLENARLEAAEEAQRRARFASMDAPARFVWMLQRGFDDGSLSKAVLKEFKSLKNDLPKIVLWIGGAAAAGFLAGAAGGPLGATAFALLMAGLGLAGSISDILRFISLYSRVKEANSYEELVPLIPELDSILAELLRNGALTIILSGVGKLAGNAGKKCDVDTDPNTARSGPNFKRKGDGDGDRPVGKPGEPTLAPNQCNTPPVVPSPDVPRTPTADQKAKDLLKSLTDGKERNPDGTPKSSAPSNTPSDKSTTTQRDSKTDAPNNSGPSLTPDAQAVADLRAAGVADCEAAAASLRKSLPGGKVVDLPVKVGNHTTYFRNGTWYDPTGLEYVLKNGYWTEAKLAAAGLLDAAKSGVFTPQQYEAFLKPFSTLPKIN